MKVQFAFNREHGKAGIKSHNSAEWWESASL